MSQPLDIDSEDRHADWPKATLDFDGPADFTAHFAKQGMTSDQVRAMPFYELAKDRYDWLDEAIDALPN
jgi:hypothetical protein